MVYRMPCPGKGIFVASSDPNPDGANRELEGWAAGNGYHFAAAPRFTVYGREQQPRQWMLLERAEALVSERQPARL